MDKFAANGRDAPQVPRRHQHPPPPPPSMSHNPHQAPLPHMFGNFNPPAPNAYPQINGPPIHMQHPPAPQPNPNITLRQPPYPPPPYNGPPGAPPSASAGPPVYSGARPREWEGSDGGSIHERDSKRMRPFPPNPNDNAFAPHQPPYNRPQVPPRNPNIGGPPASYPPHQHPPRMLSNNPPIHPPNQPALAFQQRQALFPQQAGGPPAHRAALPQQPQTQPQPQQRDPFPYPQKLPQFPGPPSQAMPGPNSYDRLPAPPRKDFRPPEPKGAPPAPATELQQLDMKEGPDQPMSFKDFLLKQPDNISSHDAQEAYDEYVNTFTRGKPNTFFDQHKDEEWFKERYDPDYVSSRIIRIREEVGERAKDYRYLWENGGSGVCAPELTAYPEGVKYPRPGLANVGRPEQQAFWEDHEGKAVEVRSTKDEASRSLAIKSEVKQEEQAPAHSTVEDGKGGAGEVKMEKAEMEVARTEDPASDQGGKSESKNEPTIDACSKGAATACKDEPGVDSAKPLSQDPDPEDTTLGEGDGGQAGNEVAENRRNADEVPPNSQRLVLPLRREHQKDTIFMRGIPLNLRRDDLTAVLKHGPDGSLKLNLRRLKLGDINPQRSLERFGWAVYDSEETAARALEVVRGAVVKSRKTRKQPKQEGNANPIDSAPAEDDADASSIYEIDCMLNLERRKKFSQGRVLPSLFGTPERTAFDVQQSVKMMRCLDALRMIDPNLNPLTDEFLRALENDGQRLDHVVSYLREVHYFCYYSGNEFLEDPTSMPPQELRPNRDRGRHMSETDHRLVRRIDERARWVLERDYDRPRSNSDNGDAAQEEAVRIWLDANTKREGENRYRCGLPPRKLFKGPDFVHKHLRTKHADKMRAIMEKALLETYRANFENDASKLEVISIYAEGMANPRDHGKGRPPANASHAQPFNGIGNEYARPGTSMPLGMYNAINPLMVGMQPFQMMMMPGAGFAAGYAATPGYANTMAFAGRGINGAGLAAPSVMAPSGMMHAGMKAAEGSGGGPPRRPNPRNQGGREFRDGGHRGRRGGHPRRGGGDHHRSSHDGRPADPRMRGSRRTYNDLDAPSNGPSFDLVRYEDV